MTKTIITAATAALMGFAAPAFAQDVDVESPEAEVEAETEVMTDAPAADGTMAADEVDGMGGPEADVDAEAEATTEMTPDAASMPDGEPEAEEEPELR